MNKQIETLLKQSGGEFYEGWFGSPNTVKFTEEELQAFVKLIVRECARIARDADLEDVEGGDGAVLHAAGLQIEQHFGVEE